MKNLLFILLILPLVCFAQNSSVWYEGNKKYFEKIEITDKLSIVSTRTDSNSKKQYARIDSLLFSFKIIPYPDELKKYSIKTKFQVLLYYERDTIYSSQIESQKDSAFIAIMYPPSYEKLNALVKINTIYKRKKWKESKVVTETLLYQSIEQDSNQNKTRFPTRTIQCYWSFPPDMLNETRKKYNYSTDELIIRTVPEVN